MENSALQPRTRLREFIRQEWGSLWLLIFCLPPIFKILTAPFGGHYEVFSEAGHLLWERQDPYQILYHSGYYLYHPACGLFFFGFFNLFSHAVGHFLYLAGSFVLLLFGLRRFAAALELRASRRNLFFFLATSEILGGILNSRLEIFLLGCVLHSLAFYWKSSGSKPDAAALARSAWALAVPSVFKLQTLALAGLLGVASLTQKFRRRWSMHFTVAALILIWSPALVLGFGEAARMSGQMQARLQEFLPTVFADFQHVFRFFSINFGWSASLRTASMIDAGIALAMAIVVFAARGEARRQRDLALALACVFMTSFSLMSQSAAFSLYLPLLALAIRDRERSRAIDAGIWGSWFLMSVLYSDLVPRSLRDLAFHSAVKAVGPILLLTLWAWGSRKRAAKHA